MVLSSLLSTGKKGPVGMRGPVSVGSDITCLVSVCWDELSTTAVSPCPAGVLPDSSSVLTVADVGFVFCACGGSFSVSFSDVQLLTLICFCSPSLPVAAFSSFAPSSSSSLLSHWSEAFMKSRNWKCGLTRQCAGGT